MTAAEQFIHRSRVNAINATTSYRAWLRDVFYRRTELPRRQVGAGG